MAKKLPAIMTLEAHTAAKHELLTRYLSRWVPIFQHGRGRTRNLVFVDGYAGAGVYANREAGSPVLMIRTYLNSPRQPDTHLHCFFVEQDPERHAILERQVAPFRNAQCHIDVRCGDYAEHYDDIRGCVGRLRQPAVFAFLDPFSAVEDPDMAVRLAVRPRSEALVYLPVDHFARFLDGTRLAKTLDGVFGDDRWRVLVGKSYQERARGLVELYQQRLSDPLPGRPNGRFYVETFTIRPDAGGNRYWLFFATKRAEGVEAIREAMWHVDPANGRLFDAKSPPQPGLELWKPGLADVLRAKFPSGTTFDFADAWQFVVDEQPPFDKPRLRAALKHLRENGLLERINPKTGKPSKHGFPEGVPIRML